MEDTFYIIGWIGSDGRPHFASKDSFAVTSAHCSFAGDDSICLIHSRTSRLATYKNIDTLKRNNPPVDEIGYSIYAATKRRDGRVLVTKMIENVRRTK